MGILTEKLNALLQPYTTNKDFTPDGLVEKNNYYLDGNKNRVDINIDVDEAWRTSLKRIAIILKDQPGSSYDVRKWLKDAPEDNATAVERKKDNRQLNGTKNCNGRRTPFIPNIGRMVWGLYNADKDHLYSYQDAKEMKDNVVECFNTIPFALLESKKICGGTTISNTELSKSLKQDSLYLNEIDILSPNIIVCTSGLIYDEVLRHFDEEQLTIPGEHNSIRVLPKSGRLIFCSHHPSWRKNSLVFDGVMSHYRAFMTSDIAQTFKLSSFE